MFQCRYFSSYLFGTLCTAWVWMSVSPPSSRNFSDIISLNELFTPLFSPIVIPIMQILLCLMVSHKSPEVFSLYIFFSLFAHMIGWVHCTVFEIAEPSFSTWSCLLFNSFIKLFSSVVISFTYVISVWYSLYLCWNYHFAHALFSWLWWLSLWPFFSALYQVNHLSSLPLKGCF